MHRGWGKLAVEMCDWHSSALSTALVGLESIHCPVAHASVRLSCLPGKVLLPCSWQ